jgi:hypothetical protein
VDMIGKGGRIRTAPILSSRVGDIRPRFVQLDEMWAASPTRGNRT